MTKKEIELQTEVLRLKAIIDKMFEIQCGCLGGKDPLFAKELQPVIVAGNRPEDGAGTKIVGDVFIPPREITGCSHAPSDPHVCPFRVDIENDVDFLCTCCPECKDDCDRDR